MIVSNASTLILLAKVGVMRKFLDEFKEITIPKEVEKEINWKNVLSIECLKIQFIMDIFAGIILFTKVNTLQLLVKNCLILFNYLLMVITDLKIPKSINLHFPVY